MDKKYTEEQIKDILEAWTAIGNDSIALDLSILLSVSALARFGECKNIDMVLSQMEMWWVGLKGLQTTLNTIIPTAEELHDKEIH